MSRLTDPALRGEVLTKVLVMPKRPPQPVDRAAIVLGFDTEWVVLNDPETGRDIAGDLLSVQLAVNVDGALRSACFDAPSRRLSPGDLATLVDLFLTNAGFPFGAKKRCRVILLAHFAMAEMSMFSDPFTDIRIEQIGKAHHGRLDDIRLPNGRTYAIEIRDTSAYFNTGLDKVGKAVGLEKLDVDRKNLDNLKRTDRALFEQYACRDAEIVLVFFERIRADIIREWDIDLLRSKTVGGVASALFRHRYLTNDADLSRREIVQRPRPLKSGEWTYDLQEEERFDGDWSRRFVACASYHGGWAEAFGFGLVVAPLVERDVRSLYPAAARLQPLPNVSTKWTEVREICAIGEIEGFGTVRFSFPDSELYPCLPCRRLGSDRLIFPLNGESHSTFAEMREALRLGAELELIRGFGFVPGPAEVDHDVRRFEEAMMTRKGNQAKGTVEYEFTKLLANALVGKLAEHRTPNALIRVERDARRAGFPGLGTALANSASLRSALKGAPKAGSLFHPEWATLILGRARSLMFDLVRRGAYLVSTDSAILPRDVVVEGPSLDALRRVESDFPEEIFADAALIARTRLYALLVRVENLTAENKAQVIYRDDVWAVVKGARHGAAVDKVDFARLIVAAIARGEFPSTQVSKDQLVAAETAIRTGRHLNENVARKGTLNFRYDNKRDLLDKSVNPTRGFTWSRPHRRLEEVEDADTVDLRAFRREVRRKHAPGVLRDVLGRLRGGVGVRAIARATGVPKSTVQDLKNALRQTALEDLLRTRFRVAAGDDEP